MKIIPSPNLYKNDQCLQYSEQELLPEFNQQEYVMKWIALQLALLAYMTAVGYAYKNHKTAITLSSIMIFGISTIIGFASLPMNWPNRTLDDYIHSFFSGHPLKPLQECVESCRTYAERELLLPFVSEISVGTAGIAATTMTVSTYHLISNFFTKNTKQKDKQEPRQAQLEEFGFKPKMA